MVAARPSTPANAAPAATPAAAACASGPADPLVIGGRQFNSRLMTGTGKYPSLEAMQASIVSSACDIVTVAVPDFDRRQITNALRAAGKPVTEQNIQYYFQKAQGLVK